MPGAPSLDGWQPGRASRPKRQATAGERELWNPQREHRARSMIGAGEWL